MENSESRRQRVVMRMHACLVRAQELGDEKMHLVNNMQELIDQKTRQMDTDKENLEIREDLEQLRLGQVPQQVEECPTLAKHARTQSPVRLDLGVSGACSSSNVAAIERILSKDTVGSGFSGYNVVGAMGERTTPHIDGNVLSIDAARGNMKRSRRRNDTANNHSMEFGNESNSANEGGSNGSERPATSRTNSVSSQKKAAGQHQTSLGNTSGASSSGLPGVVAGTSGSAAGVGGSNSAGKKKKRKARVAQTTVHTQAQTNTRDETPPAETIDPDEPTYCICNQISFGEMILCDNDLCPIEWFHFSCVSLVLKPKGKWYCPNCRGDRPNIMKPKAQFLKELERYNKEKEEKT